MNTQTHIEDARPALEDQGEYDWSFWLNSVGTAVAAGAMLIGLFLLI